MVRGPEDPDATDLNAPSPISNSPEPSTRVSRIRKGVRKAYNSWLEPVDPSGGLSHHQEDNRSFIGRTLDRFNPFKVTQEQMEAAEEGRDKVHFDDDGKSHIYKYLFAFILLITSCLLKIRARDSVNTA